MPIVAFVVLEVLRSIAWPGQHEKAEQLVFQTADEFAKVWTADVKGNDPKDLPKVPKVDWDKETVLAIFAGTKPGPGYTIKIEKVAQAEKDGGDVVVLYKETSPDPNTGAAAVVTYPTDVVVVKKVTKKIRFCKVDSEEGKTILESLKK
jgi:hypothetical protein